MFFLTTDASGSTLWKSDGTSRGTAVVWRSRRYIYQSSAFRGILFLSTRGSDGDQLWKSDGTTVGTVLVKDFWPWPAGCPAEGLTVFDGSLYFSVGIRTYGQELWRSDGTGAGTVLVKDIWPGPDKFPGFDEFCQYGPE